MQAPPDDASPGPYAGGPLESSGIVSDKPLMRVEGDRLVLAGARPGSTAAAVGSTQHAAAALELPPDTSSGPYTGGPLQSSGIVSDQPLMRVEGDRLVIMDTTPRSVGTEATGGSQQQSPLLGQQQPEDQQPVIDSAVLHRMEMEGRHPAGKVGTFGDAFTLTLAGPKMTFLFEPQHIEYFFSAPDEKITFRPAVEQFTQRVFGLTSRLFFPLHFKMLTELRHLLVPSALSAHMQLLGTRALQLLPCYVHHTQVDLYSLCRGLVFHCGVEVMFGRTFVDGLGELMHLSDGGQRRASNGGDSGLEEGQGEGPEEGDFADADAGVWDRALGAAPGGHAQCPSRPPEGVERLARTFYAFEEGFELAASPVPHAFQPEFVRSRAQLLRLLGAADRRGWFKDTPAGQLLDRTTGLPVHLRPNLLLAVLWASQANTVPATFWSVAFLLLPENRLHKGAVLAELQAELQGVRASPLGNANGGSNSTGSDAVRPSGSATSADGRRPSSSELVAAAARLAASRRSVVSRCCAEALRLRVQSIDVRVAAAPLDLPSSLPGGSLRLPRGRVLAVCPFESHHDMKLYGNQGASDPWVFDPSRPELKMGEGGAVVSGVAGLAFGGGPYRCPGRFLAEAELGLLGAAGSSDEPLPKLQLQPQPQLAAVQGGSLLYGLLAGAVGPKALAWGTGWFDGLDGPLQDWRTSGDPSGLLPPCDIRRLVGVKVPKKPCWVQLGRPSGQDER
ncbi:hypothetical protein GPECTOR_6g698 [Gonium pectorale]|uniref:Cytochrome P450 n=1 Tax=Gonium pectorale TaxID=33097 RepID=A0A150GWN2_GONPE|nr:hypothetical protein GPECTOR_6g698 [Gonium pectorale]|eukprot:KXZ53780.1 hypothetical protein GPECTOR_6g698 [Gonium pectorale]